MKKFVFIILAIGLVAFLSGCGKKQQSLEEMQEPMSMEVLNMINKSTPAVPGGAGEVKPQVAPNQAAPAQVAPAPVQPSAEPVPAVGSYAKPSAQEIQTALKNAGFYTGNVDGKIGPKTKKAIEEFQKANGLAVDGKVGAKTWAAMSKHLTAAPPAVADAPATQR
ncbi:MAG TPA: peptidoglycan-binding domain-containing protein [Patescibacteria group bacterium]|nr:peptidoglycan-binding domain-containing protein [Patescibacteria group bacterium]